MRPVKIMQIILIALGLAGPAAAVELTEEEAEQLSSAQQQLENEQHRAAAQTLETLLEDRPELAEAWRLLGHTRFELSQHEAAREALVNAIQHGRITPDIFGRLIQIDRQRDDPVAAAGALQMVLMLEPTRESWRQLYAETLRELGALRQAQGVYEQLLRTDPGNAEAHLGLGNLLVERGRMAEAVVAFETAYHLGRRSAEVARMLGDLHAQRDEPEVALRWYERALASGDEQSEKLKLRRARLLHRANRPNDARQLAETLTGSDTDEIAAGAHRLLGRIALDAGDSERAVAHWTRAVETGAEDPQLLAFIGGEHFNAQRYDQAATFLARRIDHGGADPQMMRHLVISLIRSGQTDRAGQRLQAYLEQYPLDAEARRLIQRWRRAQSAG